VAIIYWCLDHAAFYSITEDSILPAVRDTGGHYHIHGSLITAPTEMFTTSVKNCIPLFSVNTPAKKVLLSPLPRYWHGRCCDDTDHVANLDEPGFENSLFAGLDGLRRVMKDTIFLNNARDVTIFNTTQCASPQRAPGRPPSMSGRPWPSCGGMTLFIPPETATPRSRKLCTQFSTSHLHQLLPRQQLRTGLLNGLAG
jgi:hypothetical protein